MKILEKYWDKYYSQVVLVSYWCLGLCNNYAYVIMLSAAHDILSDNDEVKSAKPNATNKYDCNELSTGAVLLADILPGIVIKLISPFFMHKIKYWQKFSFILTLCASSFLIVSLTPNSMRWLIFVGICCASLSTSFGEVTFLALSTFYSRELSIPAWSSGTGAAGIVGSFGYAGLTSLGLSSRNTILVMLFVPVLMLVSFIVLPSIGYTQNRFKEIEMDFKKGPIEVQVKTNNNLIHQIKLIRHILKFMIPLFLVYFFQYFINQGLFELLYFKDSFLKQHSEQYRWYSVIYQLGVFISRSSIKCVKVKFLPIFPILQFLNALIALSQIFFGYMPSIWFVFVLVLWEGLVAGSCYVNAYNQVSIEIPKQNREFSIAFTSFANSIGIAVSGVVSIPVHNAICNSGYQ
ncbi:Battenin [Brachionus plicatilis]|uniref:Battenin n=1 Tax=Brachionus plicatilis TaxID=10195 RepID=A0A3M7PWY0_BRAPC|nr:Battenin [Brachionus plicatilis]